jgi:carbonic anhydrase
MRLVTERNVRRAMQEVRERSPALRDLIQGGQIAVVGGVYDVESGKVDFLDDPT